MKRRFFNDVTKSVDCGLIFLGSRPSNVAGMKVAGMKVAGKFGGQNFCTRFWVQRAPSLF